VQLTEAIGRFESLSLEELDQRASLLRRVDNKYAVDLERFLEILDRLRADHQVLEIDRRRQFTYCSIYFDTPELRCFIDHIDGRQPRFKARTRLYVDSNSCVFEVKLRREDGEMHKRQVDQPAQDVERLTDSARKCLEKALRDAGLEPPSRMSATLRTQFQRITLAAREGSHRLTCDHGVELSSPDRGIAQIRDGVVPVETKSDHGDSPADRVLAGAGLEPISLSKYRVGMGLVGDTDTGPQPGSELFERRASPAAA
jgi:VTC domain